ncbi:MAG: hypothetical protein GEU28_06565 [Dehalococcoidia bacterium]|nr:hypothetical protein [Dehalococcoidia bacterium]
MIKTITNDRFVKWLSDRSQAAHLSASQVAHQAGVNPATMSRILSGTSHPSKVTVEKLGVLFQAREAALSLAGYSNGPLLPGKLSPQLALAQINDFLACLYDTGVFGGAGEPRAERWYSILTAIATQAAAQIDNYQPRGATAAAALARIGDRAVVADPVRIEALIRDAADTITRELPDEEIVVDSSWDPAIVEALRGCQVLTGTAGGDARRLSLGVGTPFLPMACMFLTERLPWSSLKQQIPAEMPEESWRQISTEAQHCLRELHERFLALAPETQATLWHLARNLSRSLWHGMNWSVSVSSSLARFALETRIAYSLPTTELYHFTLNSGLLLPEDYHGAMITDVLGFSDEEAHTAIPAHWRGMSHSRPGYIKHGVVPGCLGGTRVYHRPNRETLVAKVRRTADRLKGTRFWPRYIQCGAEVIGASLRVPNLDIRLANFNDESIGPHASFRTWMSVASSRFLTLYRRDSTTDQYTGILLSPEVVDPLLAESIGDGAPTSTPALDFARVTSEEGLSIKHWDKVYAYEESIRLGREIFMSLID